MYIEVNALKEEAAQDALRIVLTMPKGTAITNKDSFGQRLIALRKERDMTQVQLAKAAQITQRAISYYETDGGSPPGPAVAQLATALKVTADELLGIQTKPREASKFERVASDPEKQRLWKRFQRITLLPERDQRAVIRLINSLTGVTGAEVQSER
jgi:transcriptional regulator with XRE-family HTH domain